MESKNSPSRQATVAEEVNVGSDNKVPEYTDYHSCSAILSA